MASLAQECLDDGIYDEAAISTVLRHLDPPPELLSHAIAKAGKMPDVVENWCGWGMVPENTLRDLLLSNDERLAAAAAFGHWRAEPRGGISELYDDLWRRAVVQFAPNERSIPTFSLHTLGEILSADGALAMDWLIATLNQQRTWFDRDLEETVTVACQALNEQQRRQVLDELPNSQSRVPNRVLLLLIGNDLEFYRELLDSSKLTKEQLLSPLERKPDKEWSDRTLLALEVGRFSYEDIIEATLPSGYSWSGSESKVWSSWRIAFESLEAAEGTDPRILEIARLCNEYARRNEVAAEQRDRQRSIDGLF